MTIGASEYEEYYAEGPDGQPRLSWRRKGGQRGAALGDPPGQPPKSEPDSYFPKGFAARRAAEMLRQDRQFAAGGGELYVYKGGVYRPTGAAHVHTRTTELLEDRWTSRHAEETVKYLMATSPQLWERPPMDTINVRNGLLDVKTGQLRKHSPEFLSPVQLGALYRANATCPAIDRFVSETFPGDASGLAFELVGHLMIPDTSHERAVMLLGRGANGKSTYLRLATRFAGGTANVSAVTLQSLDSNRFSAASLYGKLANIVADLDAEAVKSSAKFKAIVSGDLIEAERKYGAPFMFRPYARLLFSANEVPPSYDSTHAYLRRWIIVPFFVTFEGELKDKGLDAKLQTDPELSGLLNRALEALARLQAREDFSEPASVIAAKKEFRNAVDSAAAFVDQDCVIHPEAGYPRPELYRAYCHWCEDGHRSPMSSRKFNDRVKGMLPNQDSCVVIVNGTEHWRGITLASEAGDLGEPPPAAPDKPASDEDQDQRAGEDECEGGARVDKVEELPIPYSPGEEVEEIRVGGTSTFSTRRPPDNAHCCPGCGSVMSVVRLNDLCGLCQVRGPMPDDLIAGWPTWLKDAMARGGRASLSNNGVEEER